MNLTYHYHYHCQSLPTDYFLKPRSLFVRAPYTDSNPILKPLKLAIQWLKENGYDRKQIEGSVCNINYSEIPESIKAFYKDSQGLVLNNKISEMIDCFAFAASELASSSSSGGRKIFLARISGYENLTQLKDVKADLVGHFISIQGNVVRVSSIKPICLTMKFNCGACNHQQKLVFPDGKYKAPLKCTGPGCKSRVMVADKLPLSSSTFDWQKIRVQEKLSNDQLESGRIPRTIECELTRDLVDKIVPGDVVRVSGVLKVLAADDSKGKSAQMFYTYLDANSLVKLSSTSLLHTGEAISKDFLEHSKHDLESIREIMAYEGDLFSWLVHSLVPQIYGHNIVKAGLLLGLFGGRKRPQEDSRLSIRSDSHILVVGDPGLGKSQMLLSACKLAPRGVYVSGNMTSTAGLTVTVCKDAETGDTALEAGALVLGDQGVCCIDEFDKMTDHNALLEAMEQQQISIAKAGMICTLPCRTSILAAANPVGGHYNKSKSVSENLKLDPALLSRFDLVFILLDSPNVEMDKFLSDYIMKTHNRGGKAQRPHDNEELHENNGEFATLKERLLKGDESRIDPIPAPLLRKFIAYSRTYSQPRLSEEAAGVLQSFYLWLRANHRTIDAAPITTRQLESLVRLAEARARCEMRDLVSEEDAMDVVEIMKESMSQGMQNTQVAAAQGAVRKRGTGKQATARNLVAKLEQSGQKVFTVDEIKALNQNSPDTLNLIDLLNNQAILLNRGGGNYQLH